MGEGDPVKVKAGKVGMESVLSRQVTRGGVRISVKGQG